MINFGANFGCRRAQSWKSENFQFYTTKLSNLYRISKKLSEFLGDCHMFYILIFTTYLTGGSAEMSESLLCPNCARLSVTMNVPKLFDNQDHVNIDFTSPIKNFVSWSYPVLRVEKVKSSKFQRWRVDFDPRAHFTGALKWSAEIEAETELGTGIQYLEFCPCSLDL